VFCPSSLARSRSDFDNPTDQLDPIAGPLRGGRKVQRVNDRISRDVCRDPRFCLGAADLMIGVFAPGMFLPTRKSSRVGTAANGASQIAAKWRACSFSFAIARRRRKI